MACLQKIIQAIIQMPRRIGWELSSTLGLETNLQPTKHLRLNNSESIKIFNIRNCFKNVRNINWSGNPYHLQIVIHGCLPTCTTLQHKIFKVINNKIVDTESQYYQELLKFKICIFIELIRFLPTLADHDSDTSKRRFYTEC